ncbi:MAG: GDSL-type esterase/lipase family protein [Vicingaceae bacterium]
MIFIEYLADEEDFYRYASVEQRKEKEIESYATMHRYLGYVPTPNYKKGKNKHNSLGFRGDEILVPKPKSEYRIICIGGSTTYTSKVEDYKKSYPELLEEKLHKTGFTNVNVINAGVYSYTSYESLINLQLRLLDLEPNLIIIYHGVNDVHARLVWPPEAYKGDNSGYRQSIYNQNLEHGTSIWTYFNLGRIVKAKFSTHQSNDKKRERFGLAPTARFYELRYQRGMKTYPNGIFKEASVADILKENSPKYFKRNLEYMISAARASEVSVLLSTFAFCPDTVKPSTYGFKPLKEAIEEHNQIIKEVSIDKAVPLIDFAELFPKDTSLYVDDIHVNLRGSQLKAKIFGEYINSNQELFKLGSLEKQNINRQ